MAAFTYTHKNTYSFMPAFWLISSASAFPALPPKIRRPAAYRYGSSTPVSGVTSHHQGNAATMGAQK